jgi:Flp pilus assembly protein TadD
LLALNQDFAQAAYHFESAIRLKPDYASARLNYGILLESRGDMAGALREFQEAARSPDPDIRKVALDLLKKMGPL